MGLNIGSASIVMLFAVLCLTVLAALSLLSANSQYALSERSADAVKAYYKADMAAAVIYERVKGGDLTGVEAEESSGPGIAAAYSYTVEVDARQSLFVRLEDSGEGLRVTVWKLLETGDWTPDDTLDVFLG
jgi:hypothetical protein